MRGIPARGGARHLVAAAAALLAACGSSSPPAPTAGSPAPVPSSAPTQALTGSARWEPTANLSGSGSTVSDPFGIVASVLQWRVRWHCEAGRLRIDTRPAPPSGRSLVEAACPGDGDAYGTRTGQIRLAVQASGPWTAAVEQEVDTPLDEPPLPEMLAPGTQVLARGSLHGVDRDGTGQVIVYRLPDGRIALRLESFRIPINTDLYVWTEPVTGLTTSAAILAAPHAVVAPLRSTTGNQNYIVPPGQPAGQIRSVVIWCLVQQFAYVATDLQMAG